MSDKDSFLTYVALHERAWGLETYQGRPTLKQIMNAKIVAFWHPTFDDVPFTLTLHKHLREIEAYVKALVLHTKEELPGLRLMKVYVNQKEVKIKDIKVIFDVPQT